MSALSRGIAPSLLALALGACFSMTPAAAVQPASPQQIQAQQREAFARSLGYPTRKSPEELDRTIQAQTAKFAKAGHAASGRLEAPAPFTFQASRDTCYTIVMRLGAGAA